MDSHQLDIVSLAWCRELGLPHDALRRPGVRTVRPATDSVRFVRLGDASALVAPQWLLDRAADLDDDALGTRSTLLELTRDHGGRCTGPRLLAFAAQVEGDVDADDPLVSHDRAHAQALEALCPPDDVAEAALSQRDTWFTVVTEDGGPLAGAGHAEWQGIVARVGVLTAPAARRRGHGTLAGRLCTNDAIDEGMIPQWSVHPGNTAARRLAARLGYEELGSVVEVGLPT